MHDDSRFGVIEHVISDNFGSALTWEQRSGGLLGKYFYVRYEGKEIGVFMGYMLDGFSKIKGCTVFFFAHPALCLSNSEDGSLEKLFHKIMIRANMRLNRYPYRLVKHTFPAIVRSLYFDNEYQTDSTRRFFEESFVIMRRSTPVYFK